jgi:hypothetical protein
VSAPELKSYREPLDLLRRFSPTPLRMPVLLPFATVELETNDLSLFPNLVSMDSRSNGIRTQQTSGEYLTAPAAHACLWKIVRDVDVRGKTAEASIVMAGSLIIYTMGPACLMGADRDRNEILGFIGRDVDTSVFQDCILPTLLRLTEYVTKLREPSLILKALEVSGEAACHA